MSIVGGRRLRGRDGELDVVAQHLQHTSNGAGSILVVQGGPGLGKSSLLAHAADTAAARSFWCGSAGADAGGGRVDMAVIVEALVGGDEPLIEPDDLRRLDASSTPRLWLLQELQAALERVSLQRPVLVCLDDLQWADPGTAFAIRMLSQWLVTFPVCWILAMRPSPSNLAISRTLEQFIGGGADTIALSALDDGAVADVAADLLDAAPNSELLGALAQAEGNPFTLVDLIAALQEDGQVAVSDGTASLTHLGPPRRLANSIRGRLARLSPPAQRTATLAASLGRRFTSVELAALSGLSASELVIPVQEVVRSNVFTENEDWLQFQHDLVRDVVRDSVPRSVRLSLDREAVEALLMTGSPPVDVAGQLAECARPGDEVAIRVLKDAADALVLADPAASADLARSALDLIPEWHPLRGQLVARRILSLFAAGRTAEATQVANSVLRRSMPSEQEAEVRLGISSMYSLSGDVRADNARLAADMPDASPVLRARAAASLAFNLAIGGRLEESMTTSREFEGLILQADDTSARYTFDVAASTIEYELCRFAEALALLDQGELRRQGAPVDDARQRCAQHYRSWILDALDRFDEAADGASEGLAAAHRDQQSWAVHIFEVWQGRHFLQLGRLDDAVAVLEGRFHPDEVDQITSVVDAAAVIVLGRARLHRGDHRGVAEIASIAQSLIATATPGNRRLAAWFLALNAIASQEPTKAHSYVRTFGEAERLGLFPLFPHEATDDALLVRLALEVGDDELAHHTIRLARRRLELNPSVPTIAAVVTHCEGLLNSDVDALRHAVAQLEAAPRPLAASAAMEDFGCVCLRHGLQHDAIDAFDRALVLNTSTGALLDASRVRHRLRELGARRRVVSLDRPQSGPLSLTDAELRVAFLVADGNTNRAVAEKLYVSPHTVNTHLRHVFEKLAINSRTELARIVDSLAGSERIGEVLR
jgi:DNA-binding CsgD family transcriptional regulator